MSTRGLASGRVVAGRPAAGDRPAGNGAPAVARPTGGSVAGRPTGGPVRLRRLPLPVLLGGMLLAGLCGLLALNTASAAQELTQRSLTDSNASASDVQQQLVRDLAA
ncbi:MAG TPA: hypothetical protein VH298_01070, partial [Jatrophihabitans sp.]|nr:hypothetical protein [Jatrophihabitans sp.]